MNDQTPMPPEKTRELDKEAEQEFEEFVEYERELRDKDERTYGEIAEEDFNRDTVEEDTDEFLEG